VWNDSFGCYFTVSLGGDNKPFWDGQLLSGKVQQIGWNGLPTVKVGKDAPQDSGRFAMICESDQHFALNKTLVRGLDHGFAENDFNEQICTLKPGQRPSLASDQTPSADRDKNLESPQEGQKNVGNNNIILNNPARALAYGFVYVALLVVNLYYAVSVVGKRFNLGWVLICLSEGMWFGLCEFLSKAANA
jgi:hypothetical protein